MRGILTADRFEVELTCSITAVAFLSQLLTDTILFTVVSLGEYVRKLTVN